MSATLSLFRKTTSHGDIKKSAQKVADTKKDTVTRLKHLRLVLDNYDTQEAKKFFQENYSHIYYIFDDNFGTVEADLKQRANKAHREELEGILFIFEKILFLLPEIVHKRWMFHSIGRVIKKLLHPGNSLQLRCQGVRLFLVWYQCLQENANEECHQIFYNLVPGLSQEGGQDLMSLMTDHTSQADNVGGTIAAGEITSILPGQSEKLPDNLTKYFLESLLNYMVSEVIKIEWMNKGMREQSFDFIFNKFKAKYLCWLLPDFVDRDIFDPVQELPVARTKDSMKKKDEPTFVSDCRDSFIFWLASFTISSHRPSMELHQGLSCTLLTEPSSHMGESRDDGKSGGDDEEGTSPPPRSKESTLSSEFTQTSQDSISGFSGEPYTTAEYEIVRAVLYSSRENVNIVHECFRQALLQSFRHTAAIKKVISVYKEWFQHVDERPVFMMEPLVSEQEPGAVDGCETDGGPVSGLLGQKPDYLHGSLSDILEEDRTSFDDSVSTSTASLLQLNVSLDPDDGARRTYLRNRSYLGAVQDLADLGDEKGKDVRAGLQRILQVFMTNAASIFLLDVDDDGYLQDQVELCKRVLNIYRYIVMNMDINQQTWEQLLKVLLRITSGVLKCSPPVDRYKTLGGRLAQHLFQIVIRSKQFQVSLSPHLLLHPHNLDFASVLAQVQNNTGRGIVFRSKQFQVSLSPHLLLHPHNLDFASVLAQVQNNTGRGTLIATWTKANLNVMVSTALWDEFLAVLSSLTSWKELICEWSKTMETLTKMLARQVYGLDLSDLPLERLSEQKEKRKRGKESTKVKPSFLKTAGKQEKHAPRAWSVSDSQPANPLISANISINADSLGSFDRGVKYKSDGAGGKIRPDLSKQKSLSGEPSPAHSRCPSSTECLVRSSSEGNIVADAHDLLEKLRGSPAAKERVSSLPNSSEAQSDMIQECSLTACTNTPASHGAMTALEDVEVAEITTTCTAELSSILGPDCVLGDGSYEDHDEAVKGSRTPSPLSNQSKSGSHSPSPIPALPGTDIHKDSPTPDRDSLHIDIMGPDDGNVNRGLDVSVDSLDELKSIIAGGRVPGWTPDVAVVLWQRMLGCLGNVNKIEDPDIHAAVFDALSDLLDTLCRMSDNLGITKDNMSSPPIPELIPPIDFFSSWLFECLNLSNKYKRGKLMAYQLICQSLLRRHEVMPSQQLLSQFYLVLHTGLVSPDQDIVNVLIRDCGSKLFTLSLPGCLLLALDFIKAAGSIISAVDYKEPPRAEAVTVLGSLLCYPYHLQEFPVLEPETMNVVNIPSVQLKDFILDLLLKAGKREPAGLARCVAVSSVAIFLYCELTHSTLHSKMKEGINVLLGALMCVNKKVAKVATDMLLLLCDHVDRLQDYHPQMPKKITETALQKETKSYGMKPSAIKLILLPVKPFEMITGSQAIASTISALIATHGAANSDEEKRLIVSMMFAMVEWCLKMPIQLLMETTDTDKSCIYKVFRVLHSAVTGHSSSSLTRVSKSLSDFLLDTDFTNIWETQSGFVGAASLPSSFQRPFSADATLSEPISDTGRMSSTLQHDHGRKSETDIVKLAARALMTHLVNHMSHFPMGSGASRLHTTVQEHHDLPEYIEDDLRPEIFNAPNVQFFVLNHRCLVSFIELPAVDAPGGGVTAGLMTARTVCRIIVRDLCGKYCWENSVLYSPPWCKKGSSRHNAQTLLGLATGVKQDPHGLQEETDAVRTEPTSLRQVGQLPDCEVVGTDDDNLDSMLAYIGETSPECLLRPGRPLNIAPRLPEDITQSAEAGMIKLFQQQSLAEEEHGRAHTMDVSLVAPPEMPAESQDPISPFQMPRLLLDQLGLLSWEKRCHFDLLKKSDKALRELKNLDAQKCRETHKIAVIYIAPGQEDKNSILSNNSASRDFEDFVAGLGWEVDLETHQGFMGGLQQNRTTGNTAPYWASSTCEVIFHVSSRIPNIGNDWHIKMRHLGNDEVHIVWSEHSRDYRRGIIPTEFGDIIIVIYPLSAGLYRIQIDRKPEVPFFGPLFDGAIVDHYVLSGLVRATAINASRLKRSLMPFYHTFYEERAKCLESTIQQHTEHTMFEDFAENVFAPMLPVNAAIVDMTLSSESSTPSLNEIFQPPDLQPSQMSPNTSRQRASDSSLLDVLPESRFQKTARRLSMKSRRSSGSKSSTPPSPSSMSSTPSTATSITPGAVFFVSSPDSPKTKHTRAGSGGSSSSGLAHNSNNHDDADSYRSKSQSEQSPKSKHSKSRSESPKLKKGK